MVDTRRESAHVQREFGRYQNQIGENIIWFKFDVSHSRYDTVYDEGGRRYRVGINMPVLWIIQAEAPENYTSEGRRSVKTLRFAISARAIWESPLGGGDATGHRAEDVSYNNGTWFNDRSNDLLYYDGRYWEVNDFQIRGRVQEDNIISVSCTETYPEDEHQFDFPIPGAVVRGIGPFGTGPFGIGPFGGTP